MTSQQGIVNYRTSMKRDSLNAVSGNRDYDFPEDFAD